MSADRDGKRNSYMCQQTTKRNNFHVSADRDRKRNSSVFVDRDRKRNKLQVSADSNKRISYTCQQTAIV